MPAAKMDTAKLPRTSLSNHCVARFKYCTVLSIHTAIKLKKHKTKDLELSDWGKQMALPAAGWALSGLCAAWIEQKGGWERSRSFYLRDWLRPWVAGTSITGTQRVDCGGWPPRRPPMTLADWYSVLPQGWCMWPLGCGEAEGVWLLRLGHRRFDHFCLAILDSLRLGGASCCVLGTLKQPHREAHRVRRRPPPPQASTNVPALSEPCRKWILQPEGSLQMTAFWPAARLHPPARP